MELIQHQTLASAQASIVFSDIPQTYTDLLLVLSGRGSVGTAPGVLLKPNNSGTNMTFRALYGDGAGANSTSGTTSAIGILGGSTVTANTFGSLQCYIANYTSANAKSMSTESVSENNATTAYQWMQANLWNDSAAITSLVLSLSTGNFVTHTSASLYGILAGSDGITSVS